MTGSLVLASASPFRRKLLENAGVTFETQKADIDERAIESALQYRDASPSDMALILAKAKALDVGMRRPGSLVIGSDQTMALGSRVYHKPQDMREAREHLLSLSGQVHELNSAVVLARGNAVLWTHSSLARLSVRHLTPAFVDAHLARVGESTLSSVGAYQLEGEGIQLFDAIDGDYFTILGLPLLPLLGQLRTMGVIDA